jgi:integrase/recombinase XerD
MKRLTPQHAQSAVTAKIPGLYQRNGIWWLTFRHAGKKQYVSLGTRDYAEAVGLAARVKASPMLERADRLRDECDRFIAAKLASHRYSRHTAECSSTAIRGFAEFTENIGVGAVKAAHLEEYWQHLRARVAPTSALSYFRALRSFFSDLHRDGRILANPFAGFRLPKVAQAARERFCTAEERDRLIAECEDWDLRFVLFAGFHAGMRRMEIGEAVPAWFDLDRGYIGIDQTPTFRPKDRENRTVPMTTPFLQFLRERPLPSPWVLKPHVKHGRAMYRYDFRLPFERYVKDKGLEWVTPHVMRHTFASLYVSKGGSLYRLSKYLGDTPETTEKHYAHLVPDREDVDRSL